MGQYISCLECSNCSEKTYTFDVFMDVSLPLPEPKITSSYYSKYSSASDSVSLLSCFDEFSKGELLEDFKCGKCKQKGHCSRKTRIYRLPKILVIHLKRFSFNSRYEKRKIKTSVSYPITGLHLDDYLVKSQPSEYSLYGVTHH